MHPDGRFFGVALSEIIAFEDAGHGVFAGEREHVGKIHFGKPLGIVCNAGFILVQNLRDLLVIAAAVLARLLKRQRHAGLAAAGRIADHRGEIADDEHDLMPEVLKHAQLAQHDGMAEMQVGPARVGAELDLQASAAFQLLLQSLLGIDRHGVPEQIFIHFLRCHNKTFLSCNL